MYTCTWAPSTFSGTSIVRNDTRRAGLPDSQKLQEIVKAYVGKVERLGLSHLLIAQRWGATEKKSKALPSIVWP